MLAAIQVLVEVAIDPFESFGDIAERRRMAVALGLGECCGTFRRTDTTQRMHGFGHAASNRFDNLGPHEAPEHHESVAFEIRLKSRQVQRVHRCATPPWETLGTLSLRD